MIDYQAEKHETLLVAWFFQLQSRPEEFQKLFMAPLRNLTSLLQWAKSQVKFLFSADEKGIWAAGWFEPIGTSAFFGTWLRLDARSPRGYAFVRRCQRLGLEHNEELIGLTCQPELEAVHLALGYEKLPITLKLFDNRSTWVYVLTKEGLKHGRRRQIIDKRDKQPLRGRTVGNGEQVAEDSIPVVQPNDKQRRAGHSNRGRKLKHPVDKPRRGRKPSSRNPKPKLDEAIARASGAGEHSVRPDDPSAEPADFGATDSLGWPDAGSGDLVDGTGAD